MRFIFSLLFFFLFSLTLNANTITHIKIANIISPATSTYLKDAFKHSKNNNSSLILIELDTPGGLASSMRDMIQDILNSKIPVVMFVSPKGARAASAGTFLMYASHIAVMSEGTNIGAATPVNLFQTPKNTNPTKPENEVVSKPDNKSALEKKVLNDSLAYIKSIAELRNRNITWAMDAVKEGKSISAKEALEIKVIDFIANDIQDLLQKIHGKKVLIDKKEVIIDTKDANLLFFEASWKTRILMFISNPNIAYVFLIVAMYGILFEMMNPGSIFPGVMGVTSAVIALYALNILPFNYVGLLLIFLGIIFIVLEIFVAGFGILGIAGVFSFVFGSILLFDEKTLGQGVSLPLVFALGLSSLSLFIYILTFLIKSRKDKLVSGIDTMIGKKAIVVQVKENSYKIMVDAELWNAKSDDILTLDQEVEIQSIKGLTANIRSLK
ncbi:MAG: nodulation protein NfeD [Poseidonibacter sp.]|uniref:NfeD family protein n=1 Tax=Poseidonibacter sp. TaxID=2321188 RepID=UPI00359CDFAB